MAQIFEKNEEMNGILKLMWEYNNILANGGKLTHSQRITYNMFVGVIQDYYRIRSDYWMLQHKLSG